MGQFSADLFLRLAKDVDDHNMLKGIEYDDPSYGEGTFGKEGNDQINEFKNAVFMTLMMRAREYLTVTRQEDIDPELRHTYASFGITLIDSDVHRGDKKTDSSLIPKITGGIGSKTDSFHYDDREMAECVRLLFTGKDGLYNPIVKLACTQPS